MRNFDFDCPIILVIALGMTIVCATPDLGQAAASAETPVELDIQPQPLVSALDRYGDVTGREVFYDAALAEGRRSAAVKGRFLPTMALRMLLEGTGLAARFLPDESYVLMPIAPPDRQMAVTPAPPAAQQRYYGHIQENLRDAFCRSAIAQPGRYRVVAVFRIGEYGNVQSVQRLGSAGSVEVDRGIDETLRSIRLSEPPPAGFPQPVLIMIVPQAPGVTMGCETGPARLRSVGAEQP